MDDYAGRVLADRYRLPLPPADADADDLAETRAFDTFSGQEVLVRQVPLPEFVDAEVLDGEAAHAGAHGGAGRATRRPAEPVVRRAIEAAQAAAQIPDHPLLDQVFDVFAEAGSLWIVSERVAARPLAALLAERPLNPYRAAEIGADVLTALRALHAHGWVHRNITARTVLVCDDGRVVLTGLAVGAAEEALCGYAPVPESEPDGPPAWPAPVEEYGAREYGTEEYGSAAYESGEYGTELYEAEVYEEGEEQIPYGETEYVTEYGIEYGIEYGTEHGADPDEDPVAEPADDPVEETGDEPEARTELEYGYGHGHDHGAEQAYAAEPGTYAPEPDSYAAESGSGSYDEPVAGPPGPRAYASGFGPDDDTASPYGTAPDGYGTDPYGRSVTPPAAGTQPAAAPPTADVRAARAGAIAAYRAGARAAARLGETGALPAQRPAPADPPEPPPAPTAQAAGAPEPQWWARVADDDEDDEDDGDEPYGGGSRSGPPPRVMLAGSWSDGPHASRDGSGPIPAGGGSGPGRGPVLPGSGRPALPAGYTAATPDPTRLPVPAGSRGEVRERVAVSAGVDRGPTTRLAAERARQTRIAVVGAVTERWAPEQAGPVHENWRLAPPIGPATDLWALGALLYRAVQGHAPYPEDSAAELVQLVCAEPPAFAEECGPLRPVVESLLRQDPTERPDFEELRGWLRSLVRSAPEPEAGLGVVPLPSFDETRLPIVRRRGELVRRRRGGAGAGRHRHKRGKDPRPPARHEDVRGREREPAPVQADVREEFPEDFRESFHEEIPQRASRSPRAGRPSSARQPGSPHTLGRTLLVLVVLLLGGAVAYAVLFMPGEGETSGKPNGTTTPTAGRTPGGSAPATSRPPATTAPPATPRTTPPAADPSAPVLAAGYALRQDPEGFRIGVPDGWRRSAINDAGQVRYSRGDFTMIVVPGRDSVRDNGSDPVEYQNAKERELEPWRASSWSRVEETRRIDIGTTATATGSYVWLDSTGREVYVRNLALISGGRYHVVQVIGPDGARRKVSEIFDEATKGFRPGR